jgi:hypothetical protein
VDWHELGAGGDYPIAVRKLIGFSGVYAIRERRFFGNVIVYVGESHTGRLYKTLTRHFQSWSRGKKFWRGVYQPDQTDPGHTYDRGSCDVAWETCTAKRAAVLQAEWIESLRPRDNAAPVEEVPF